MTETRERTREAIVSCGYWLAACLRLGWRRDELEFLEALWWKYHNHRGELMSLPDPPGSQEPTR